MFTVPIKKMDAAHAETLRGRIVDMAVRALGEQYRHVAEDVESFLLQESPDDDTEFPFVVASAAMREGDPESLNIFKEIREDAESVIVRGKYDDAELGHTLIQFFEENYRQSPVVNKQFNPLGGGVDTANEGHMLSSSPSAHLQPCALQSARAQKEKP
jgi:hypothetical protein